MSKKFGVTQSFMDALRAVHGVKQPEAITEEVAEEVVEEAAPEVVEEEQIDELKSSTLRSYASKVTDKIHDIEDDADRDNFHGDTAHAKKEFAKAGKHRASRSLAKMKIRRREDEAEDAEYEAKQARKKVTEDTEYEYIFIDAMEGIVESLQTTDETVHLMFSEGVEVVSTDDIIVEEVEDLAELTKETLRGYTKGAEASIAATKKKGKPSKAVVALRAKRTSGIEAAKAKLKVILDKERDEHEKVRQGLHNDLTKHWDDNHHQILEKHGFKLLAQGTQKDPHHNDRETHIKTYAHSHDHGHVSMVSIHHTPKDTMGYTHGIRAANSKGTSWSTHHPIKTIWDEKDHKRQKEQMLPEFEGHLIKVKNETDKHSNW